MNLPTISEYNSWTNKQKHRWIERETNGKYKKLARDQGYFPFLIYEKENVGIIYKVNRQGQIFESKAMTVKEAFDKLEVFHQASKALSATN